MKKIYICVYRVYKGNSLFTISCKAAESRQALLRLMVIVGDSLASSGLRLKFDSSDISCQYLYSDNFEF